MRCRARRWWLLSAVLLAGCAAPPFAALALDGIGRSDCAEVVDRELFDVLRVGAPSVGRAADGRLQVALPVASLDDEPLDVVATVRFVDAAGRVVPGGAVRCRLRLSPGAKTTCAATAPAGETQGSGVTFVVAFDWDR